MWVHEQGLGSEQNMLEAWVGPILARKASFKKSASFMLEREREMSKNGGTMVAMSRANEAQGSCLASPKT